MECLGRKKNAKHPQLKLPNQKTNESYPVEILVGAAGFEPTTPSPPD